MASASSRLPQECWDEIVGELENTADLKSCALTGRLFVNRAQASLFHNITIMHPKDAVPNNDPVLTIEEDREYTIGAYTRLHSVLSSSQHLKTRIRVVVLSAYVEAVALVADMDLPRLSDLTLVGPDDSPSLDGPLVPPLTRLIALPSLRRLNIRSDFDASIFADCSSQLEELVLGRGVRPWKPWVWAPSTSRARPALKWLDLEQVWEEGEEREEEEGEGDEDGDGDGEDDGEDESESEGGVLAWLLHPNSPFALTGLEEFAMIGPMTGQAHLLLQSAASSIQRLEIGPNETIECLDLVPFSVLHFLRLYVTKPSDITLLLGPLLRLAKTTDTNNIQTICFDVAQFSEADKNPEVEAELGSFYRWMKRLQLAGGLPSLQRVGFPLLPEPWGRDPGVGAMFQRAISSTMGSL